MADGQIPEKLPDGVPAITLKNGGILCLKINF